ncbi:TlpA disulfide reductase family protein [Algirhabdus cladophorae]|uniref:TlpA disulfide reductase family protein n=1 Tax=Algirhabdus cladophorae TaxID=3377108 RepID=UPI003B8481E1
MKFLISALLYTVLGLGAISSVTHADPLRAAALAEGDMKKLRFHKTPVAVSDVVFQAADGSDMQLADLKGQYVVLNFWAMWCAPCLTEMPHLSHLQDRTADQPIEVVTVAVGRNNPAAVAAFFAENGIDNLPFHKDTKQRFARDMRVLSMPVTVVIDPDGMEIARMLGAADWGSDNAVAVLEALLPDPS